MKNMKTYITMLLLLIFTFSSVGVAISKHVCHTEGVIEFSLTGVSTCAEHQSEAASKNCCKKPVEQSNKKPDCCDEDFVYAVLDIAKKHEENRQDKIHFTPLAAVILFHLSFNNALTAGNTNQIVDSAPLLLYTSVNNLLADISVFRL
jgi:hypothetical protein